MLITEPLHPPVLICAFVDHYSIIKASNSQLKTLFSCQLYMMIPLNSVNIRNMGFHDVVRFIPVKNNRLVSDAAARMERMVF